MSEALEYNPAQWMRDQTNDRLWEIFEEWQTLNDQTQDLDTLRQQLTAMTAERDVWTETARQNQRNTDYYRGLVEQIGELFGVAAKTADDGGVHDRVLCAKVPELVAAAQDQVTRLRAKIEAIYAESRKNTIAPEGAIDWQYCPGCASVCNLASAALREGEQA